MNNLKLSEIIIDKNLIQTYSNLIKQLANENCWGCDECCYWPISRGCWLFDWIYCVDKYFDEATNNISEDKEYHGNFLKILKEHILKLHNKEESKNKTNEY